MAVQKKIRFLCSTALVSLVLLEFASAGQLSEADLVALSKQDLDNDSERLFEYVKTTSEGIRLGCKGKVRKGDTGKVQALFIEDSTGRRELRKLAPTSAKYKNYLNVEEDKYIPLRDFPMYCLERVFTSSSCPPGPPGRPGRDGRNGTIGLPGLPGGPGKNGYPGNDAHHGWKGPDGTRGENGPRGDAGDPGVRGEPGLKGPQGPKGPDGRDGIPGLPGAPGKDGIPGEPGTPGLNGVDGVDGPPGLPGLPGENGIPGPDGLPGIPGLAGNNGFDGADGTDGQNGINGVNGIPGTCCGTPSSGWSSGPGWGSDDCSDDDDSLGSTAEYSENTVEEAETPSQVVTEEENVKNKPSSLVQKPNTSSFWLSNTDIFSIGSMDFKNNKNNKNKSMKGKVQQVHEEDSSDQGVQGQVESKAPVSENVENDNELSAN